ncbi:Type IV pilin PilA [Psychrobacter nivimaris]|uniref:Type IV pilin PilA n=1 Tax=Psychrobacter nivimaris TaxID=281738 RepID=A0A6N7C341_9GAMM|nr:type IV pilin protein [Psychrobacter nivimaris]KAF0569776.1 Type IV pilin PilA [Psychrobacter nivimaris]
MATTYCKRHKITQTQYGFTLIELMIVIAIIGVMAAIVYPSYQQYIIKAKRADMMSEMQNIASVIESRKLAQGSYSDISSSIKTEFAVEYPKQGNALYDVTINPLTLTPPDNILTDKWIITAVPKTGSQMAVDGNLSLNYRNVKCRGSICGNSNEWNR